MITAFHKFVIILVWIIDRKWQYHQADESLVPNKKNNNAIFSPLLSLYKWFQVGLAFLLSISRGGDTMFQRQSFGPVK